MTTRLADRILSMPSYSIGRFFDISARFKDVISLGIGEPDFKTPAVASRAGIAAIDRGETKYTATAGNLDLRCALASHLSSRYHVQYDPDKELLITAGVSEALHCAVQATINPGDQVIVPEPSFTAYKPIVMLAGGNPVVVETCVENGFQVTGDDLDRAVTPRTEAILIGYPNNPTGAVMTRARLQEVACVAEKHDLVVFSDELYDRLVYGVEHICFASLPGMRARTILLGGFSKDYAMTGWRVGFAAAPREILDGILKVHQYIIMTAPTVGQVAALEGLLHAEPDVQDMVREYDQRRRVIVAGLNMIGLPTSEPRGALYVFPDIRSTGLTSDEFSDRLLMEEHVAVIPGNAFGRCGEGYVRAVYASSMANIEEALTRIERFAKRHR
jgi:aminotransferase